jgi:hypothetical protein
MSSVHNEMYKKLKVRHPQELYYITIMYGIEAYKVTVILYY